MFDSGRRQPWRFPLRCCLKPPETERYRVIHDAAPYEEAEEDPRLNPVLKEPVIMGQNWRVNSQLSG